MLPPKELNFCKDVAADILRSPDNFSWIQEGEVLSQLFTCWKSLRSSDSFWGHRGPESLGPQVVFSWF
jgi:hypothetical protein